MKRLELLREAVSQGASDIHIVPNSPPLLRIYGALVPLTNRPALSPDQTQQLILEFLTEPQRARLADEFVVDFSVNIDQTRFRGNALFQRNGLEAVLRLIPEQIPGPEELLFPPIMIELTNLKSGLILVTGPAGSGKSSSLACLIDLINQRRRGNIVTIEDPIEFIHTNKNCVVSQREIGVHATSFSGALRSVMRQDPDVVMIGEMRDLETISAAITVAETGHLVLGTLHSADAAQAVDRMIDVFEARQQQQIRTQLAGVLKAVIMQDLLPRSGGGGRVAMREVMIVNAAISNLIRMNKNHEIPSAIEMGAREGMISASRSMAELAKKGLIDFQLIQARKMASDLLISKQRTPDRPGSQTTS
jgi:twitching motility protein PilT